MLIGFVDVFVLVIFRVAKFLFFFFHNYICVVIVVVVVLEHLRPIATLPGVSVRVYVLH